MESQLDMLNNRQEPQSLVLIVFHSDSSLSEVPKSTLQCPEPLVVMFIKG
jgi:hypothetical protein